MVEDKNPENHNEQDDDEWDDYRENKKITRVLKLKIWSSKNLQKLRKRLLRSMRMGRLLKSKKMSLDLGIKKMSKIRGLMKMNNQRQK